MIKKEGRPSGIVYTSWLTRAISNAFLLEQNVLFNNFDSGIQQNGHQKQNGIAAIFCHR